MSFSLALESIKLGHKVCRSGWNGKGMFLFFVQTWRTALQTEPDFPHLPFIVMKTADDKLVPWLASQTDILAEDWMVVV